MGIRNQGEEEEEVEVVEGHLGEVQILEETLETMAKIKIMVVIIMVVRNQEE